VWEAIREMLDAMAPAPVLALRWIVSGIWLIYKTAEPVYVFARHIP
jgi:hypothetical protein